MHHRTKLEFYINDSFCKLEQMFGAMYYTGKSIPKFVEVSNYSYFDNLTILK